MVFFISFLLTLAMLYLLINTKFRHLALDRPNERSLHVNVTPRTGGIAIMFGSLMTWLFIGADWEWLLLPIVLIAVSLVDDMRGLKARWRLFVQIGVCSIFIALYDNQLYLWSLLVLLVAMVWMVNLFNFMDGADGLAGGMALFGFSTYGIAAYLNQSAEILALSVPLAGANLAFLIFNFHPARIFMGDAGSIPQGFMAAALGLMGWQHDVWPAWFPVLVFSPFIIDASVTLAKRIWRSEKIWQAHKTHYYQRLIQMGWGHARTAIAAYGLMLCVALTALLVVSHSPFWQYAVLTLWGAAYGILLFAIDRAWQRNRA